MEAQHHVRTVQEKAAKKKRAAKVESELVRLAQIR